MSETYTRPQMDNRSIGGDVPVDAAGQAVRVPVPDAADEVRGLVESLLESTTRTNAALVVEQMSMAVLKAQEHERSRLAEELHDGPAQAFANAIFQTEILERTIRETPAAANEELATLRQILERELDTLRAYINQLRPSLYEAEGLEEALRDSASGVRQRGGPAIEVMLGAKDSDLQEAARTVVLRVAQEALRNIAKHSGASRAWLVTREIDGLDGSRQWQLEVGDDGRGFDINGVTANPNRRHFGLRFMRERAELLGSELSITTSAAGGTILRLTIQTGGDRS